MVSDVYIESKLMSPWECRKLMLQLGVTDFISVPKRVITVTEANKASTPWPELDMQPGCTYTDFDGAEFGAVIQSVLGTACPADCSSALQRLVQTLDRRWKADYSHCLDATYTDPSGELYSYSSSCVHTSVEAPPLPPSPWAPQPHPPTPTQSVPAHICNIPGRSLNTPPCALQPVPTALSCFCTFRLKSLHVHLVLTHVCM